MIFLTVGTHEPFDRLVRAVDAWAGGTGRHHAGRVFGQITDRGSYRPEFFEWTATLPPPDYKIRFAEARLIVAHAGMGSIIGALTAGKPILILPRREALRETRNDHQFGTALRFRDRPGITACMEETEIGPALDRLISGEAGAAAQPIGLEASPELIAAIRAFISGS